MTNIRWVSVYRYLYEHKCVRIITWDGIEYLLQCKNDKHREKIIDTISSNASNLDNSLFDSLPCYRTQWQVGALSNGDYLLLLNFLANRSFNDLT